MISSKLSALSMLKVLALQDNTLSGTIAPALVGGPELQCFTLNSNSISGILPPLGVSMQTIVTHSNNIRGTIPSLRKNSNLRAVVLSRCQLSGSLPNSLSLLSSLELLSVDNNNLDGELPSLEHNKNLVNVTLHYNQLRGKLRLPVNETEMQMVLAIGNQFSCVPPETNVWCTHRRAKQIEVHGR